MANNKKRIVIIGGCAAGPKCAAKSRRMDPDTEINLYTKSDVISYSACGIPYYVSGDVKKIEDLIVRTPEDFAKVGVNVHVSHACRKINPAKKSVIIHNDIDNTETTVEYDELVIATGALAVIPKIPGIGLRNIFHLRMLSDGIKVKEAMNRSKHALILGAGYISIELLEAFTKNNLKVTTVERSPQILPNFDPDIAKYIENEVVNATTSNVTLHKNDEIVEFIGENGVFKGARTKKGVEIYADFCLISAGVIPNVELAKEAGIEIGVTGAIRVDRHMKTNIPNIWAAGDCTEKFCMITKEPQYISLGSIANKEGRVCAINLNDGYEEFEGILGSAVAKYHDYTIAITGMTEKAARATKGLDVVSILITDADKAGYMPEMKEITLKLVGDRKSRKILGAQAIGKGDADKRVNSVTAAIQTKMNIDEFVSLDLTYSPAFSTAIDPLLAAAAMLKDKMDRLI